MDFRVMGLEAPLMSTLHHLMESASPYIPDDDATDAKSSSANGGGSGSSTRTYVRDARAMASTPVDVKELPSAYVFEVDMPGVRSGEIKVQVEDDNLLVISGERKRGGEEGEGKYLRMERRMGKFMRKFALPENANTEDGVSAACADGVLTVTVKKLPPPEPKKPKTIEVKVA
ncbi:17.0 kDa class II heat shock protein-like [Iris pallida]|uniref:17.0 kDa class II heat shock protein-like n=1 Tax=Iris pallida TaxID=29817 RepID=A0AAX6FL61_IRIPA|nr:17.0 kDa class II heat shock protein-like [Iris pallida]